MRFMAKSPDNRIFVTDMYNLADNTKGAVYVLDEFNPATGSFKKVTTYLKGLRNPNSIAFYTDQRGVDWFYLALTDHLLRYKYNAGESTPSSQPEVLASFPRLRVELQIRRLASDAHNCHWRQRQDLRFGRKQL